MPYIFTAEEFCNQLKKAVNTKTLYVNGAFGAPAGYKNNRKRYSRNLSDSSPRKRKIMNASDDTFFFDCVCLIKGICWGWNADPHAQYGGAVYRSNGIGDWAISTIAAKCKDKSTNFADIVKGEFVWLKDYSHCGVYIGNNQVIECTPKWSDNVQITYINKISSNVNSDHVRKWYAHGMMPWIDYTDVIHGNVLDIDGYWGIKTTYFSQIVFNSTVDGEVSSQPNSNKKYLPCCETDSWQFTSNPSGSRLIRKMQELVGATIDGFCGIETVKMLQFYLTKLHYYYGTISGIMDNDTVKAWQMYISDRYMEVLNV